MSGDPDILCIGSVLWDIIGRSERDMVKGSDMPGRIRRLPGGVAMNVAMTLVRFDMTPALLSAVGQDAQGAALLAEAEALGLITQHVHRPDDLPTDTYMAIEDGHGLIAAIADANSLEAAGDAILTALLYGPLGTPEAPWGGLIALDGNLTTALLGTIATSPAFAVADLRVAPASPGKAERLLALIPHPNATFYVNLEEAGLLCGTRFTSSRTAATALLDLGVKRCLVTDGPDEASFAQMDILCTGHPPAVTTARVTGAGDTFMAAHIAAEHNGDEPMAALTSALAAAARYVSGDHAV